MSKKKIQYSQPLRFNSDKKEQHSTPQVFVHAPAKKTKQRMSKKSRRAVLSIVFMSAVLLALIAGIAIGAIVGTNLRSGQGLSYKLNETQDGYIVYVKPADADNVHSTVVIPKKHKGLPVIAIEPETFKGNQRVKSVTIPASVTEIGHHAFFECTNLAAIRGAKSVDRIGAEAFGKTAWLDAQSNGQVYVGNVFYSHKGEIHAPQSGDLVYTFRAGTRAIADNAMMNNNLFAARQNNIPKIIIPAGVLYIGERAFENCENLAEVVFPSTVLEIGAFAFSGCKALTNFTLPASLEVIGAQAFAGITNLTSIVLPDKLIAIGDRAFRDCIWLTAVSLPASLKALGEEVFAGCTALVAATMHGEIQVMGADVFRDCPAVTIRVRGLSEAPSGWHLNWNSGVTNPVVWNYVD